MLSGRSQITPSTTLLRSKLLDAFSVGVPHPRAPVPLTHSKVYKFQKVVDIHIQLLTAKIQDERFELIIL